MFHCCYLSPTRYNIILYLLLPIKCINIYFLKKVNEGEKGVMIVCEKCVSFWNALRDDFGCNGNSTLCNYFPYVSHDKCQAMINATCAAGILFVNPHKK